jgi:hypothetical protein
MHSSNALPPPATAASHAATRVAKRDLSRADGVTCGHDVKRGERLQKYYARALNLREAAEWGRRGAPRYRCARCARSAS